MPAKPKKPTKRKKETVPWEELFFDTIANMVDGIRLGRKGEREASELAFSKAVKRLTHLGEQCMDPCGGGDPDGDND